MSDKRTEAIFEDTGARAMPLIALRGKVLFPNTVLNFDVGRPMSINAVNAAMNGDKRVFIAAQKNAFVDAPLKGDILDVGVIADITQVIKAGTGAMKVTAQAVCRAKIINFTEERNYFEVVAAKSPFITGDALQSEACLRLAKAAFFAYVETDKRISREIANTISMISDPNAFMDNVASVAIFPEKDVQELLATDDTVERLNKFRELLSREAEIIKIEKKISAKVRSGIDKSQKEFFLREQIKAIHQELGDDVDEKTELKKKIEEKNFPQEVKEKALKELSRLDKINPAAPDYSVIMNYLDWLIDLPFSESSVDTEDISVAKEILNKDHFGLTKVKERITEYIAVLKLTEKIKGPILCFVGPPGVGKTSVASSIARALNRKFVRMSLGGVKDEAEIRGHRKTYVGAMPGRIIYGIKSAGVNNPVFLLDEIDKLSMDIHGDPSGALLEVLDPEQNKTFRDRFLEVPFDLSKVLFITTANTVDTIPYPLLDRMEIIEINGYTNEEKEEIAKRYLIPKQTENNGLTDGRLAFTDDAVRSIIENYTMEAGVRNLERQIASAIRKVAAKVAEHPRLKKQIITAENLSDYLGVKRFVKEDAIKEDETGACTGLAWTSVGGVTLTIEVSLMYGKGEILLTGKLGDVMKESARAAISYIHAHAEKYGISEKTFSEKDIHIHVPEGATPKDGPSAGITMATAILSAYTGKKVKKGVAMTGEITLRGKVLPIGGLKEKALAAFRAGIKTVIIPKGNAKDLSEIPSNIRKEIKFVQVENVEQVFENAIRF
ncbi:MAG: endopeptidase La [Clostridia bacterium]|nr:endopeptidase La [Clostridia bacterium]